MFIASCAFSLCKCTYRPHTERQKEKILKPKLKIREEEKKKKRAVNHTVQEIRQEKLSSTCIKFWFFNFASFFLVSFLYSYFPITVSKHCQTYFLLVANISQSIKLYKCIKHLSILHTACPHYNTVMGSNELSHQKHREKLFAAEEPIILNKSQGKKIMYRLQMP